MNFYTAATLIVFVSVMMIDSNAQLVGGLSTVEDSDKIEEILTKFKASLNQLQDESLM